MKENKNEKKQSRKRLLLWSATCLATFGVTAAGVFFLLPQRTIISHLPGSGNNSGGGETLTPSERFVNGLIESATSGLSLSINNMEVSIPGAVKSSLTQSDGSVTNTYYDNVIATIPGKPAGIKFAMDSLSLSGINLSAELPLSYNGLKRELNLGLLGDGETEKNLYFNIADIDGDAHDWDAGYQVSVLRETDTSIIDPVTGGNPSYEYGRLDFVIHDIVEILTKGGINLDTYGKIEGAINGSGTEDSSSDSSSSSSFDTDAIMDALNQIEESKASDGSPYFTLNLPLGGITYSIGLKGDADYNLTHVDLPAIESGKEQGKQTLIDGKDWTIQLSADVETKATAGSFDWTVPAAWKAYPKLDDSLSLYRRIANYVASPKFGVSLDVDLEHHSEAVEGTYTTFGKKEVREKANLHLGGDVDLSWKLNDGKIEGADFNAARASLSFSRLNDAGEKASTQKLDAWIDNGDTDQSGAYINYGDVLKARATKTMLDELMGKFSSSSDSSDPTSEVAEKQTDEQMEEVLKTIESVLKVLQGEDDFKTPTLISNLREKHYEALVDMIDNVTIADNLISVKISLAPMGFEDASVILVLDGSAEHSLAKIQIKDLVLRTLTVNLTLETPEFEAPEITSDMASWGEMSHLPTLVDQIKPIAEDKKLGIGIEGKIDKEGTQDVYKDENKVQGLDISGRVAFDFGGGKGTVEGDQIANPAKMKGTASLKLTERAASYYQDHNIAFDLDNEGDELLSDVNHAYFHYDSKNDADVMKDEARAKEENRVDPTSSKGINGQIGLGGLGEAIDGIKNVVSSSDERFGRISKIFSSGAEASLIGDLSSGKYFSLADYTFLNSASFSASKDEFVFSGDAFGMSDPISLALNFNDDKTLKNVQVNLTSGEEGSKTDVDFRLSLLDLDEKETFESIGSEKESYDDYSGLGSLVSYAAETATLGLKEGKGVSTYDLGGTVALQLGDYQTQLAEASMALSVEGARVKAMGSVNDIPVIRGLNAPDSELYFRPLELGGKRDSAFYYYSDGREDKEGNLTTEMLLTRSSDYGRLANVSDSVKLNEQGAFQDDALNYILEYALGVNESYFDKADETSEDASSSSSGLSKAIHVDDLYKGFQKTVTEDGKGVSYDLTLNLNGLLGADVLDDIHLNIGGGTFTKEGSEDEVHALNSLHLDAGVGVEAENTGNRMSLVQASVDLVLKNLANGVYRDGWAEAEKAYSTNFLTFDGDEYTATGIYAEPTDQEGGKAWRHGVDKDNKGHRNYYLSK